MTHLSKYAYILLEQEKWWKRRVARTQAGENAQVFVRKSAVGPIKTKRLLFYVNRPIQAIMGAGDFEERVTGKVEELWSKHGEATIFKSNEEYMEFIRGRTTATFIRFRNLVELNPPIALERLLHTIGRSRLPRSGRYLSEEIVNRLM